METLYTIKPANGSGYTWPLNEHNRKIELINNKLPEDHPEKITQLDWVAQDGPFLLTDFPDVGSLNKVSEIIFGEPLEEALVEAQNSWEPYIANGDKDTANRIIISGTTNNINARDGVDIDYLKKTGNVIGANALKETRELALARPGDISFGNSEGWKEVARNRPDVETNLLGEGFLNYNSHRWLYKVLKCVGEEEPSDPQLQTLINHLAINPELVVQVYANDEEHDLLFRYIKDKVNRVREEMNGEPIEKLKVDANSTEITEKLASKAFLYPKPEDVANIEVQEDTYEAWLDAEGKHSDIEKELDVKTSRMPGYGIEWEEDFERFREKALLAINLMGDRWGVESNYFKHTQGADGSSAFRIDFNDGEELKEKIVEKLYSEAHSWVLEPFIDYRRFQINGQTRTLAPSVHVRGGKAFDTKLIQILVTRENEEGEYEESAEWGGHVYAPKEYVDEEFKQGRKYFEMNESEYYEGFEQLNAIAEGYLEKGFSRGGIDTAIGTINTRWGKKDVNILQDMNIRANGGDVSRAFGELVEREYGKELPFTTLIIKPELGLKFADLDNAFDIVSQELGLDRTKVRLLASVPPGWGLFGLIDDSPEQSFINALHVEEKLRERGIIL